ncbi:M56 family metallopeptidase [Oscillibacter sp.]|uniref:M56 family metallopeptidase n=1 Tax=Oscillibacter sp. TaxID=1945593 RepID=UPI0028A0E003|nr:M56 family metallopeptidase [Oscillibacter sp.]
MLHFRMGMPLYLMAFYGSMMIVVVFLLRSILKSHLPKPVFPLLWGLVLIRLLVPFSLSSPISAPVPEWPLQHSNSATVYISDLAEDAVTPGTDASDAVTYSFAETSDRLTPDWQFAVIILFGLGTAITAGVLLIEKLRYSRKLKNSLLVEHNQEINKILRDMGMGHILVFTNDEIASPLVCGILNPHIYLPSGINFQKTQLLGHILTHEIMHIKRRDNWIKAVMLLALCLNWYNPLVWFMSKCLSSDLEAACDAAVLRRIDNDERKDYAASLLSMAITGNRFALLYSAFSKTEVEHRIKSVLNYQKTTAFILALSVVFVMSSTIVFATGGQAPFSAYLSSYCSSTSSRWGVKAGLARDIALGEDAGLRADNAIFDVLDADTTNNPETIADQVKAALAKEFKVERGAFLLAVDLCLMEEEVLQEYAKQGITKGQDGFYLYKGEAVRTYEDEMLGSVQTRPDGSVDIAVNRNRLGQITSVTVLKQGDEDFDRRSKEIERSRRFNTGVSYSFDGTQENAPLVERDTAVEGGTKFFR